MPVSCRICDPLNRSVRLNMCAQCERSYDRDAHDHGSVFEAMEWAARRAAHGERKRAAAKRKAIK